MAESFILPGLVVFCVLSGLRARIDVYGAFVRGAKEGLGTLVSMTPYLCAVFAAAGLLRETGALAWLQRKLMPALALAGIPGELAGLLLLRPLSASAALAEATKVMAACGADSRAGFLACVISGASETVFFTGSLYLGAAGVKRGRYALAAAFFAYVCGVLAAAGICRA